MSGSQPWGSSASPSHPRDRSKVILRSRLQGTKVENWAWEEGIYSIERMGKAAVAHASLWIFPKKSVYILSQCKEERLVACQSGPQLSFPVWAWQFLHSCGLSATSPLQASPFDGRDCLHPFLVSFAILLIPPLVNQFSPLLFCLTWQRTEKLSDQQLISLMSLVVIAKGRTHLCVLPL